MSKEYQITMNGLSDQFSRAGDVEHLRLLPLLGIKAQVEFCGDEFEFTEADTKITTHNYPLLPE